MTLDGIDEKPIRTNEGTTKDSDDSENEPNSQQLFTRDTIVVTPAVTNPNTDKNEETNLVLVESDLNSLPTSDDRTMNLNDSDHIPENTNISNYLCVEDDIEIGLNDLNSTKDCSNNNENSNAKFQSQLSRQSGKVGGAQSFRLTHRTSFLTSNVNFAARSQMGNDFPDATPEYMSFTYLDACMMVFSIGTYLFDIISDITVATLHYLNGNYWYFCLTVVFVAFPALIMTCISLRWYILDSRELSSPKVSKLQLLLRLFFLMFQLGPIMRYIDSLLFGFKFRKHNDLLEKKAARKYFHYMIYEDTDATMLRLFECFMEAAPQLVLQIYILANSKSRINDNDWTAMIQIVSVFGSLVSLSWSLVSYQRILRMSLIEKKNMTWPGTIVQFIWRLLMIASRVLALALFASAFTYYISIVCSVHWLVMLLWIVSMNTNFCDNCLEELFYNAVLATMFIFCYFNPVDSPTRWRYTLYYSFMLLENSVLIFLWYLHSDSSKWYRHIAMIGYYLCFFSGLVIMIIYYLRLHPTGNIQIFINSPPSNLAESNDPQSNQTIESPSINNTASELSGQLPKPKKQQQQQQQRSSPNNQRNSQYRRQFSDVWTTQGRLLHPRPVMPIM